MIHIKGRAFFMIFVFVGFGTYAVDFLDLKFV